MGKVKSAIINSPFDPPEAYWKRTATGSAVREAGPRSCLDSLINT